MFKLAPAFVLAALAATGVMAEQRTVTVVNNCGYGTPTFTNAGNVVTTGASFLFSQATAVYLQNGSCGPNGERCTAVHLAQASTLGLSYRISVTPPNAYTVPVSVHFYNGCEGQGAECKDPSCLGSALRGECFLKDSDLQITFCPSGPVDVPAPAAAA
ncbi:unnamed protein product [Mycena citricolor]|uniref:Uncharacterized protein n=1 Tax=Mycena citricolor TaxID=2018698 RepID=A0AAD2HB11_9AGAR|nr:unnamed protein product [Mycena citricolor]